MGTCFALLALLAVVAATTAARIRGARHLPLIAPARWGDWGSQPGPFYYQRPLDAMVDVTNQLGAAVLEDHAFSGGNFAFSPYGAASVLVVLYEGARGESARQIHAALRLPWDRDVTRVGFRDIHRHLRSYFTHEGYLSGMTLSKNQTSLRPEFQRVLRFYGYDVDLGMGPSSPEPPTTTTDMSDTTTEQITTVTAPAAEMLNSTETEESTSELPEGVATISTLPPTTEGASSEDGGSGESSEGGEEAGSTTPKEAEGSETPAASPATESISPEGATSEMSFLETTTSESDPNLTSPASTPVSETLPTVPATSEVSPSAVSSSQGPPEEVSSSEATSSSPSSSEASSSEDSSTESQSSESLFTEDPSNENPSTQAPSTDAPSTEAPSTDAPSAEVPSNEATSTEPPSSEALSTEAPSSEEASSESSPDEAPPDEVPSTPSSEAPSTETLPGEFSSTEAPSSEYPSDEASQSETSAPEESSSDMALSNAATTETLSTVTQEVSSPVEPSEAGTSSSPDASSTGESPEATRSASAASPTDTAAPTTEIPSSDSVAETETEAPAATEAVDAARMERDVTIQREAQSELSDRSEEASSAAAAATSTGRVAGRRARSISQSGRGHSAPAGSSGGGRALKRRQRSGHARRRRAISYFGEGGSPAAAAGAAAPWSPAGLRLQNGWYDSHVSRGDALYTQLPRLPFLVEGVAEEAVPVMTFATVFPFAFVPRLDAFALEFPLDDERYRLLLLLPRQRQRRALPQLTRALRYHSLREVCEQLRPTRVHAVIPSFMVEGFVTLTGSLQQIGVWDVFDPRRADLGVMSDDPELYVRNIEQAVTVVIRNYVEIFDIQTRTTAARSRAERFVATHPFLYFVVDTETRIALIAGKIVDPLNSRIH